MCSSMDPLPLKSKTRVPKTFWYQTDDRLVLRIMLPDIKDYFLNIDLDHLQFSTMYNGIPYYLCIYFFGAVLPEKVIDKNMGREIRIQIPKALKFYQWPRLQYHHTKASQIVKDPESIAHFKRRQGQLYTSWSNEEEYKQIKGCAKVQYDAISDHDDSDDERYNIVWDEC